MVTHREEVLATRDASITNESSVSAVSWAAILAGAAVAAAASLLLVALGAGLGFASLSPWSGEGLSATTFTVMTAIWLILVQWIASGVGGYLTGRLRTKWAGTHTHEVFFRDTAHGFVTWAVATVATSVIVALAASAAVSAGAKTAASVTSGAAQVGLAATDASGYQIDTLFRSQSPSGGAGPEVRAETMRVLMKGISDDEVSAADHAYLADLIASHTGISQQAAEQRLDAASAQFKAAAQKAREVADAARKSASAASIFTAFSMLIGAFIASVAAALGGRERDLHP
jgi:hypothetical protein